MGIHHAYDLGMNVLISDSLSPQILSLSTQSIQLSKLAGAGGLSPPLVEERQNFSR
jgi:hypothetical protein